MVEGAPVFIEGSLILFGFFGSLRGFAFEECGDLGLFIYSDGNCYFFRPTSLTRIESCPEFGPGSFRAPDRFQGLVMEKEGDSYFWSLWQSQKVLYYVKSHTSNRTEERRCPGNFGSQEVHVLLTSRRMCWVIFNSKIFVNGIELRDIYGWRPLDVVSVTNSSMILFLIQKDDNSEFIYKDTELTGRISIKLPKNRLKGTFQSCFQPCTDRKFILIQDEKSKQIQIYVYSVSEIIGAARKKSESYPLNLTHSLEFKPLLSQKDFLHSIMIRYPYKLQALMFTVIYQKRWYLIIPDIPYSAHIVTGCNVQDGRNGSHTAVCSESFSPFYKCFPFVFLKELGVHVAFRNSSGPNDTFIFQSHFITTCFLMNDCYGCRLSVFRNGEYCSWDGEKCLRSKSQEPFKKCISLRNITENNGALEINVKGVRLTNTFMKVHILAPDENKIKPVSTQDHEVIFRPPESILANWLAGKVDLFLEIDNEIIKNSVVRFNLAHLTNSGESPSYSQLISWLIALILIVILFIFAFRKFSKGMCIRAPQSSVIESSTSSLTQSNLFGVSNSPVEFSVWGRDTGFRASGTSRSEEGIRKEKKHSNTKKVST